MRKEREGFFFCIVLEDGVLRKMGVEVGGWCILVFLYFLMGNYRYCGVGICCLGGLDWSFSLDIY